ncbi:hypothetical protein EXU48_02140 [Occultella glacieicola]|uniref:Heme exporter protein D n=1 Tax=Occultella glacieicola TaxID=2518684 RepID=A0ABY2EAA8_9MICO|nr:hypothetical protein [Occultella glacieicola]TDE99009.1 hypothetical protein EXU48_02140 [Occultella glacieicola]
MSRAVEQGARLEYQSDFNAVVVFGTTPNHILHLLLSVFTAGLWLIGWLVVTITQREKRVLLEIDDRGKLVMTEPQRRR